MEEKTTEKKIIEYKPFIFKGNSREFFRIWIVNIALTILTLGIYSAWAKVRTNRYFYANTYLNNSNFEYNANPKRILAGRVIVVGLYGLFILFSQYLAMYHLAIGIFVIAILALPWLIRQAVSFKLRNTSYRNVPFRYIGKTRSFYYFFIINALLPILLIIIISVIIHIKLISTILIFLVSGYIYIKFKELIINNSYYGANGRFRFFGTIGEVYGIYLKIAGWLLIIGLLATICLAIVSEIIGNMEFLSEFIHKIKAQMDNPSQPFLVLFISILMTFIYLPIIFFQKGLSDAYHLNFVNNNTLLNNAHLKGDINPLKLAWISATNILAIILSLGLLYPWTKIRYFKYKLEHIYFRCSDYEQFKSLGYETGSALGEESIDFFDIDIGL